MFYIIKGFFGEEKLINTNFIISISKSGIQGSYFVKLLNTDETISITESEYIKLMSFLLNKS